MATSLHQQLKQLYVSDVDRQEVLVAGYRIDAIDSRQRLIEVQCATLSSIRDKVRRLLETHSVIVVKPLASRKLIVKKASAGGEILSSRNSPQKQSLFHVFRELVNFATVFPHPRLQLHILMTRQEEIRIPPTARSSWKKPYSVADRTLVAVDSHLRLKTPDDLWRALDVTMNPEFTTADLAIRAGMPLWLAQKAAYCFRTMGLFEICSKQGNSIVYRLKSRSVRRKRKAG